jgi:hypothetical protein
MYTFKYTHVDSYIHLHEPKYMYKGVLIALAVGLLIGMLYYCSNDPFDWPTDEMASRGV